MEPIWRLVLHSFRHSEARQSLSHQLLLLKSLAHMPPGVALTWRLQTIPGDSTVFCDVSLLCTAAETDDVPHSSLVELENIASVALATGYSLSEARTSKQPNTRMSRILVPEEPFNMLPVKADWAMLIDLIRHRGESITIDLICTSTGRSLSAIGANAPSLGDPAAFDFDAGVSFLASLSPAENSRGLSLEVGVGAPTRVDASLMQLIGQSVLGVPTRALTRQQAAHMPRHEYPAEVVLRAWHAPYTRLQGRGILAGPRTIPAYRDLSKSEGAVIGTTQVQGPDWDRVSRVRIPEEERLRHIYIVGKTGAGKTNLMKLIAEQDMKGGYGVAVITPHADLIDHLLDVVGERARDVILLDFGDPENVPVLNPLTLDTHTGSEYSATCSRTVDLFARRAFNQFAGPVFADSVRLAFETVAELVPLTGEFPTIAAGIEIIKSDKIQRWASRALGEKRPDLADEWETFFNMRGSEAAETSRWVTAKFNDLGAHSALRAITTQTASSPLSIRDIYRKNKILLVRIPDTHMAGSAASLIGTLLFNRLFEEAKLAGVDSRRPFYVHVDEFQRFVNSDLEELVAEARKFHLGLTFAHQNLRQLEAFSVYEGTANARLADAIFSNVGTLVTMKTAGRDVQRFADELSLPETDVRSINRGHAIVRTGCNGEDVLCTISIPLVSIRNRRSARNSIRARMVKEGYWMSRDYQDKEAEKLLESLREAVKKPPGETADALKLAGKLPAQVSSSPKSFLDDWVATRPERTSASSRRPSKDPQKKTVTQEIPPVDDLKVVQSQD